MKNTNALIICKVEGQPSPEVSWKYRGQKIENGGRYLIEPNEGLYINNITTEDNGLYECRASVESMAKFDTRDITVYVHSTFMHDGPLHAAYHKNTSVSFYSSATDHGSAEA